LRKPASVSHTAGKNEALPNHKKISRSKDRKKFGGVSVPGNRNGRQSFHREARVDESTVHMLREKR